MWRSKARVFLIRCTRQATPSIPNQVQSQTLALTHSPAPHFSACFSQNPRFRFFSNDSNVVKDDENDNLVENPSFISHESVSPSMGFDENPSLSIEGGGGGENTSFNSNEGTAIKDGGNQESVFSSMGFDENPSLMSIEGGGENPSFLLSHENENENGDEQMDTIVLEEEPEPEPVIEEIHELDLEQVEIVLSVLQSSVIGSLGLSLDKLDLTVTEEFGMRVIETPLVPGESLIGFFKWASKRQEFSTTTRLLESLVQAVCSNVRKNEAYSLWDLIKEIGEKEGKGVLNTEILNQLISLFWKLRKGKAALEVFNKFEEFGCDPNTDSYYLTIEALCARSIIDWAWPVCEKMLNAGNLLPDGEKIGKIICCFCKGKRAKDAHLVYLMAKEKNKELPRSAVSFLICSLASNAKTVKLAVELLEDLSGDARKYAIKPFSSALRGLCRAKDIEGAKSLLFKMIDAGPPPGNSVFNLVISALSKSGELEEAIRLKKVMESRGLRPDVYTYSLIINGYTKGGQMEEACRILSEAKEKHSKLTPDPYQILIRGYCELEEFEKALKLLSEMKESGILPTSNEYKNLIQSLCLKALDWETAEELLKDVNDDGLYLTGITRGLVQAVKELEEEEEVLAIEA